MHCDRPIINKNYFNTKPDQFIIYANNEKGHYMFEFTKIDDDYTTFSFLLFIEEYDVGKYAISQAFSYNDIDIIFDDYDDIKYDVKTIYNILRSCQLYIKNHIKYNNQSID